MFRIHGTRWVQAGSRLHRTVSRKVLLINGEVFIFCGSTGSVYNDYPLIRAHEIRERAWDSLPAMTGYTRWKERNERPSFSLLPLSRQRLSLFPVLAVSPVSCGDFHPRSYFTDSSRFELTKLTGLTCSFRYQKPTDFHRKRLNLLTQKPLYLHVTLNILDD